MEFQKERVYTALNADELKPGSKVICANYLEPLKAQVEANSYPSYVVELSQIMGTSSTNRFKVNNKTFNLAYLVSEPEEKNWIVYLCRGASNPEDYYLTACRSDLWKSVQEDYRAKTKLFEGTEDEVDEWYTNRRHLANVIAAWEDGKTIQFFQNVTGKWEDIEPTWSTQYQYRIKPEGLKWTDLKVGDVVRRINLDNSYEAIVVAIDKNPATGFHVMIANGWVTDEHLAIDWGKVE